MSNSGLQKLHVSALQYDFPLGLSKAYANKLLCAWGAHFLKDAWQLSV